MAAKLEFEHNLQEILKSLGAADTAVKTLSDQLKNYGKATESAVSIPAKTIESSLKKIQGMGRSALQGFASGIKTFLGVQAVNAGLSMTNQFKNTLANVVSLSDAVRKLGDYYGIAEQKRAAFQAKLSRSLGEKGLGMEVGAAVMGGLRGTGVKNEDALAQYAVSAGSLAQIGGEKGAEGAIASGLADALRMRGIDASNIGEMRRLSEAVNGAMQTTGQAATDILSNMTRLYAGMSETTKKMLGPEAAAQLASIEAQVGPGALSFLEPILSAQTMPEKERLKALGMDKLVGAEGLNIQEFEKFMKSASKLGSGDVALGLRAKGLSSEQVNAAMLLQQRLPGVKVDQARMGPNVPMDIQLGRTRGAQEGLEAMQNRAISLGAGGLASLSQGGTELLQKLSTSDAGAVAGSLGGAAAAGGAINVGGGAVLRGIAGVGGGSAALGALGAGAVGLGAGALANKVATAPSPQFMQGFNMAVRQAFDNGFEKLSRVMSKEVSVKTSNDLKVTKQPTRGASQGP